MSELKDRAEALGIKVDGRWSEERIQQEIDRAGTPSRIAFRIARDFWDEAGERHRKGTIVEMTAEEALSGVEAGALARVA